MKKKHVKLFRVLNYIDHLLISTVTGYAYISSFASLVGIPIGIMNSAVRLETCAISAIIKNHNLIIKKKKKKHDKLYC